ncbi:uncharacterized protein LOC129716829 [Wyeomyia smithii]|uniref:uncharacterized protein LOC129716829 n=1 Tax=Wyeomyia smithii TaxID=174621 RepID=UPI002467B58E|nr:uncharacterized protein LOC129716829 [Wyeomyia smithii]
MDAWKRIKTSGSFKRSVKKNFNKINNVNPQLYKKNIPLKSFTDSSSQKTTPEFSVDEITPECSSSSRIKPSSDCTDTSTNYTISNEEDFAEPELEDETFANMRLLTDLQSWAVKYNIRQTALKELLTILNTRLSDILPRDPRTLLKTVQTVKLVQMDNGQYWHQGIETCIDRMLPEITEPLTISVKVNIDGLPVYKSSKDEFWPILINIDEFPQVEPMIVGIYAGKQKPACVVNFLTPFVDDMEIVCKDGIIVNGHKVSVAIKGFVCDSPARAFIKGTAYFNAQNGCQKCTTTGEYSYVSHTNYFPRARCPPRTDWDFRNKKYGSHHKNDSPLLRLNIDMIKDFAVGDSLHLIDLGIMKKLLLGWRDGKFGSYNTKWPANVTVNLSKRLLQLRMPHEIHRALRGVDCIGHWKGLEFRTFLNYVSIVVLKPILSSEVYEHFLSFFCAITICSSESYTHLLDLADMLLMHFHDHFKDIYGEDYVSSNVHNLTHLIDDVKRFGILSRFSAYPFENKLFQIKNLIRSGRNPLSQIAKRLSLCKNFVNQWFLTKSHEVVAMNFVVKNRNEETKIKVTSDSFYGTKLQVFANYFSQAAPEKFWSAY